MPSPGRQSLKNDLTLSKLLVWTSGLAVCAAVPQTRMSDSEYAKLSLWGEMEKHLNPQNREHAEEENQPQDAPWINRRLLEGEHPTKDKICIISAYVNSCDEMDKFTEVNKKQYARKHGYTFHAYKDGDGNKFALILEVLETGCDWAFWSDADAYFQNDNVPLSAFTNGESADFIFSWMTFNKAALKEQIRWARSTTSLENRRLHQLNSGHFFVKNTEWAKNFLKDAWKNTPSRRKQIKIWRDQGNIVDLILQQDQRELKHFAFYSFRAFNSHYSGTSFGPGMGSHKTDFIIHVPGSCRTPRLTLELCQAMVSYDAPFTTRDCKTQVDRGVMANRFRSRRSP